MSPMHQNKTHPRYDELSEVMCLLYEGPIDVADVAADLGVGVAHVAGLLGKLVRSGDVTLVGLHGTDVALGFVEAGKENFIQRARAYWSRVYGNE